MNDDKQDATKLAAALAPLEEQNPRAAGLYPARRKRDGDAGEGIFVDGHTVKLDTSLLTDQKFNPLHPSRLVVAIVSLCVLFILFVAWQISQMPAK